MARKNIVILSDGTWNSPEDINTTNVVRMARVIAPFDDAKNTQVVFYDWGVGSDGNKILGGIAGVGLEKNIKDCYRFLVHNYNPGDRLFFFGFSRGAYTVRSLAGLVRKAGILKREHAGLIAQCYSQYRRRSNSSRPGQPGAIEFRDQYAYEDRTEIAFVGVWDTVGHLGIPVPFWGTSTEEENILFHDNEPSSIIRCARHAMSIDENRSDFKPALWDAKEGLDIQQVWFPGVHADVGGGYKEAGLSNIAMHWIIREAQAAGLNLVPGRVKAVADAADPLAVMHDERRAQPMYKLRDLKGPFVRDITGPLHISAKLRWEADAQGYRTKSRAMKSLVDSVQGDWSRLTWVS